MHQHGRREFTEPATLIRPRNQHLRDAERPGAYRDRIAHGDIERCEQFRVGPYLAARRPTRYRNGNAKRFFRNTDGSA
jgi:hypothetical protein